MDPTPPTPPTLDTPATPPTPPVDKKPEDDPSYKLGKVEEQIGQWENFGKQVNPILAIINENPEVFKVVNEALGKKYGTPPQDPPKPEDPKAPEPSRPDPVATDTRNAVAIKTITDFVEEKGINKLDPKEAQRIQGLLSKQFSELVDPQGNKNISQILSEISLTQLPKSLENAWKLTKLQLQESKDTTLSTLGGTNMGAFGSIAAGESGAEDENTLTAKEKEVARNMGISEEKYLESKKSQAKKREQDQY